MENLHVLILCLEQNELWCIIYSCTFLLGSEEKQNSYESLYLSSNVSTDSIHNEETKSNVKLESE